MHTAEAVLTAFLLAAPKSASVSGCGITTTPAPRQPSALSCEPRSEGAPGMLRSRSALLLRSTNAPTRERPVAPAAPQERRRLALERVGSSNQSSGAPSPASQGASKPPLPGLRSLSRSSSSATGPSSPTDVPGASSAGAAKDTASAGTALRASASGTAFPPSSRPIAAPEASRSAEGGSVQKAKSGFELGGDREEDADGRKSQMAALKARWAATKAQYQRAARGGAGREGGRAAGVVADVALATVEPAALQAQLVSIEQEMRMLSSRRHA